MGRPINSVQFVGRLPDELTFGNILYSTRVCVKPMNIIITAVVRGTSMQVLNGLKRPQKHPTPILILI